MGGLGILLVIVFYLAISLLLVIQVKPILAKLTILLIAILLPTADAVYGRYKLKQMCEAEGGLKIYRVAHDVKGFMGYASEDMITKYGYEFVEECRFNSKSHCYRRYMEKGSPTKAEKIVPKSKYQVREYKQSDYEINYWRYNESIETIPNGEVLATYTNVKFLGGWAEQFLAKFTGAGSGTVVSCSKKSFDTKSFILSVLKP